MADKIINNCVEFAYATQCPQAELKDELEKRFLYQSILVVDELFEFGNTIKQLESIRCDIKVARNAFEIQDIEKYSCILVCNCHNIDQIKLLSLAHNIPYVIVMTRVCDSSCFKPEFFERDASVKKCNYPLGIIFCTNYIFDAKKFVCKAVLEISSLSFQVLQQRLCNLFFAKSIDYDCFADEKRLLRELQACVDTRRENIVEYSQKLAKLYVSYCLLASRQNFDMSDNLLFLCKMNGQNKMLVEVKYIFNLIVTSLQKNFFTYYTTSFCGAINYQKHCEALKSVNLCTSFAQNAMPVAKLDFLLAEFREKILDYVNTELGFERKIKNIVADVDVDFLFDIFEKCKNVPYTNILCIEPDVFERQNFLTVMYQSGLLNFEF